MTIRFHRLFLAAIAAALIAPAGMQAQTNVIGAGATFPYPIYSKWFDAYRRAKPDIRINYQSLGSGAGIRQITDGTVDFGGTDMPMTDAQIAEFKTKRGTEILHFPSVLGAVVPVYNIPGVTATLKFTPEVLAGIYLGTITKWNDASITAANPGITLPARDIVVIRRSDGSGTTFVWTDYLSKVSPQWKQRVGANTSVNWPVGLGGRGNEGVANLVRQTPGALGYVELIYALQIGIKYGDVRNAEGEFITASTASVSAAAAGAAATMPADFRVSITNPPGKGAYPISSFTWLLVPTKIADPAKQRAVTDFLRWMIADGQTMADANHYARLPQQVIAKLTPMIAQVK